MSWASFLVCAEGEEKVFKGKATLLSLDEQWTRVTSVNEAIKELNTGKLKCADGFGIVHSKSHKQYFCVYRSDRKMVAYTAFGVQPSYFELLQLKISELVDSVKNKGLIATASDMKQATKQIAGRAYANGKTVASEPKFQVTAGSAAVGGVTLGAGGGAVGLTTGAVIGGAIGIVPAIFTFGLSIPFSAAIGGGVGLCVGTAAGGTTGVVVGGATGYEVYTHKDAIKGAYSKTCSFLGNKKKAIYDKVAGTGGTLTLK